MVSFSLLLYVKGYFRDKGCSCLWLLCLHHCLPHKHNVQVDFSHISFFPCTVWYSVPLRLHPDGIKMLGVLLLRKHSTAPVACGIWYIVAAMSVSEILATLHVFLYTASPSLVYLFDFGGLSSIKQSTVYSRHIPGYSMFLQCDGRIRTYIRSFPPTTVGCLSC